VFLLIVKNTSTFRSILFINNLNNDYGAALAQVSPLAINNYKCTIINSKSFLIKIKGFL